jgi:hypothetical protein
MPWINKDLVSPNPRPMHAISYNLYAGFWSFYTASIIQSRDSHPQGNKLDPVGFSLSFSVTIPTILTTDINFTRTAWLFLPMRLWTCLVGNHRQIRQQLWVQYYRTSSIFFFVGKEKSKNRWGEITKQVTKLYAWSLTKNMTIMNWIKCIIKGHFKLTFCRCKKD